MKAWCFHKVTDRRRNGVMRNVLVFTAALTALVACGKQEAQSSSGLSSVIRPGQENLISCKNAKSSFIVRKTAVTTLFQGVLSIGSNKPVFLNCKSGEKAGDHPDASATLYSCVEARNSDGKFLVTVETIGLLGTNVANVSLEQIFPLKPSHVATLPCSQ